MRAVLQRVTEAAVSVDLEEVGRIGRGLLVLVGVGHGDDPATAARLAEKVAHLRMFEDDDGKTNLSLLDVGGAALVVSQFTLFADVRKGRRPSFTDAAEPLVAEELVEAFRASLEGTGIPASGGRFGARMAVSLINDGPFTLLLDTDRLPGAPE
jgi:D-tyrosyl-tRNA(Tyr) deacylase